MSSGENLPPAGTKRAEFGWPGGDRPGELRFDVEVSGELAEALDGVMREQFGEVAQVRALTRPDGAIGRFAVTGRDGREWFVRVSARWGEPAMEQAITGFLQERGVRVNHLVAAGVVMIWNGERLRVDVRERVRGRHFDGSIEDLRALSETLARCHDALRHYHGAEMVRKLAASRFERLAELRAGMGEALARGDYGWVCHDAAWAEMHAEWLRDLASEFQPRCDLLAGSQCLHGQIHQANVLYAPEPVLVDWEEAVHSFAPVQWDLAYFVQRFCLHDEPGEAVMRERLRAVREAYGAPLGDVYGMMRHVAWLSMVTLAGYHQRGIESPLAEYEKFVRLAEQARGARSLLEEFAS